MRKLIISIMIMLCAAFSLTAIGCKESEETSSSSSSITTYTVTFDANGGLFTSGNTLTVSVEGGKTVQASQTPTKDGYTFAYWAYNGVAFDFNTSITSNLTLTAVYNAVVPCKVTFTETAGVKYTADIKSGASVAKDETVTFQVDVSAFYSGNPIVLANGKILSKESGTDNTYSFTATTDTVITVTGVRKAYSAMVGTGAFDDAFTITQPVDLLFIAQQINAGVSKYVLGNYVLANDIDVKGEELEIIGDASTDNSFFGGCFNGQGYTVSNFVINADDANYVGFFGWVMVNPGTQSSGLIHSLNIANYEINASLDDFDKDADMRTLTVGSMVGYSIGAQLMLCSATDGEVNLYADKDYFSYAGGLIGYQQSTNYNGEIYSSSVIYSHATNVNVSANDGLVLYAGGIAGYMITDNPYAASYILNSYATGSVKGAIRSGGLVGGLGQYCSVANSYSAMDVGARSHLNDINIYGDYCTAAAGALVAYAENNSIVSNSFATGKLTASSALPDAKYKVIGEAVAMGDAMGAASVDSVEYVAYNCLYVKGGVSASADLTSETYLKAQLQWKNIDWIFSANGQLPVINYDAPAADADPSDCMVTIQYLGGEKIANSASSVLKLSDYYYSFAELYLENKLQLYPKADSGKFAYGYFFDEGCTKRVPYGFIVTKDLTLYVPFADYTEVAGTYYILPDNAAYASELVLKNDSTYSYQDGNSTLEGYYVYNGAYIIFENARFSSFFNGYVPEYDETGNAVHALDKYQYSFFMATIAANGNLAIYDGNYFTEDAPLTALAEYGINGNYYNGENEYVFYVNYTGKKNGTPFTYTVNDNAVTLSFAGQSSTETLSLDGSDLSVYDAFKGVWEKGEAFNQNYTFDGKGGWSFESFGYTYNGNIAVKQTLATAHGTYTLDNGVATLSNGQEAYIQNGVLYVNEIAYYAQLSFKGEWCDVANRIILTLHGIGEDGVGEADIEFLYTGEIYALTYERMAGSSSKVLFFSDGIIFGSASFNKNIDMLEASLYTSASATITDGFTFLHFDKYNGEWVSNSELFDILDFNGFGNYEITYQLITGETGDIKGAVNINGEQVPYQLTNDGTLNGTFVYEGVTYTFSYDNATQTVRVTIDGEEETFVRKDELSAYNFITQDGIVSYVFDGKGTLTNGGTLTIKAGTTQTQYKYVITATGADVFNGAEKIAVISKDDNNYIYTTVADSVQTKLYLDHDFRGDWAINGRFDLLTIGAMDLNGKMQGSIVEEDGVRYAVEFQMESEGMISYTRQALKRYIFSAVNSQNQTILALSNTPVLSTSYVICTRPDKMYGTWTGQIVDDWGMEKRYSMIFDGCTDPDFAYGNVKVIVKWYEAGGKPSNIPDNITTLSYRIDEYGTVILWASGVGTFRLDFNASNGYDGVYTKDGVSFARIKVDDFYNLKAMDENDVEYTFDGEGNVTASNGKTYTYVYQAETSTTNRYVFILTNVADNTEYMAVVDTSNPNRTTITLELL